MSLELMRDWRMQDKPGKERYSILILNDYANGTQLYMYFQDNKLTGFRVLIYEGC